MLHHVVITVDCSFFSPQGSAAHRFAEKDGGGDVADVEKQDTTAEETETQSGKRHGEFPLLSAGWRCHEWASSTAPIVVFYTY